ncbi:MAG: hypothetical protein ACOY90_19740 [Candidatus Zhuqueibacterota bacterium]
MSIINELRNWKNSAIAAPAMKFVNDMLNDYGEMVDLTIDSLNKNIKVEVLLKGEKETIFLTIEHYEVVQSGDSHFLKFNNVSCTRQWIEAIIQNMAIPRLAPTKMLKIDSRYARLIDLLI